MKLSNRDLLLLSDGLLALIKNYGEAQKLVNDERIISALSGEIHRCQRLNSRLMVEVKRGEKQILLNGYDNKSELLQPERTEKLIESLYGDMSGLEFCLNVRGISQTELADELGIQKQNIHKWVKDIQGISKKHISAIENILAIPKEYFMERSLTTENKIKVLELVGKL